MSSINIKPSVLNFMILNEQGSPRVAFAVALSQFVSAHVEAAMYLDNVTCIRSNINVSAHSDKDFSHFLNNLFPLLSHSLFEIIGT